MADHAEATGHASQDHAEALSEAELDQLVERVYRLLSRDVRLSRARGEAMPGPVRPIGRPLC